MKERELQFFIEKAREALQATFEEVVLLPHDGEWVARARLPGKEKHFVVIGWWGIYTCMSKDSDDLIDWLARQK